MLADSLTRCIQHAIHTCPTNVQSNPTRGGSAACRRRSARCPHTQKCTMVPGNYFDGCEGLLCTCYFSPIRGTTWNEIELKNLQSNHNLSTHY